MEPGTALFFVAPQDYPVHRSQRSRRYWCVWRLVLVPPLPFRPRGRGGGGGGGRLGEGGGSEEGGGEGGRGGGEERRRRDGWRWRSGRRW